MRLIGIAVVLAVNLFGLVAARRPAGERTDG